MEREEISLLFISLSISSPIFLSELQRFSGLMGHHYHCMEWKGALIEIRDFGVRQPLVLMVLHQCIGLTVEW